MSWEQLAIAPPASSTALPPSAAVAQTLVGNVANAVRLDRDTLSDALGHVLPSKPNGAESALDILTSAQLAILSLSLPG